MQGNLKVDVILGLSVICSLLRCISLVITCLTGRGMPELRLFFHPVSWGIIEVMTRALRTLRTASPFPTASSCFISPCAAEWCGAGSGARPTGRGWYRHFNLSAWLVHLPVRETLSGQPPPDSGRGQQLLVINNQPVKLSLSSWSADNLGQGWLWETIRGVLCPWIRPCKACWDSVGCPRCCWWGDFSRVGQGN